MASGVGLKSDDLEGEGKGVVVSAGMGKEERRVTSADEAVDAITDLYRAFGDADYIGEDVSQLEHALQCANCAARAKADDETIIGALLHDIGHIVGAGGDHMEHCGVVNHEGIGREYCDTIGFPSKVGRIVEGHVQAKRYLCWKTPAYHRGLSEASKTTLRHQGGVMTDEEAKAFEKDPLFDTIIKMRTWDEKAKVVGADVPPFEAYRDTMLALLKARWEE